MKEYLIIRRDTHLKIDLDCEIKKYRHEWQAQTYCDRASWEGEDYRLGSEEDLKEFKEFHEIDQ